MKTITSTVFLSILSVLLGIATAEAQRSLSQKNSVDLPLKNIRLPEMTLAGDVTLQQALMYRRSVRKFTNRRLEMEQISQLAWAGQGLTEKEEEYRAAPSAGALYPIELYFVIPGGMYIYSPEEHSLTKLLGGDIRDKLADAALNQVHVAKASCNIIIVGRERITAAKYGKKARDYMLLEAGHIAQNILLKSVELGLGSVPVGAFNAKAVAKLCRLSTGREPLYIVSLGYPAEGPLLKTAEIKKPEPKPETKAKVAKSKKALFVIAGDEFIDEELLTTRDVLAAAGIETAIAGPELGKIRGLVYNEVLVSVFVKNINVDDYDALIFVSGFGTHKYFKNKFILQLIQQADKKGKILAAIKDAPVILANAGVLRKKRATAKYGRRSVLRKGGAEYINSNVERDDRIVTAQYSAAASEFGKMVTDAILGRPEVIPVTDRRYSGEGKYVKRRY